MDEGAKAESRDVTFRQWLDPVTLVGLVALGAVYAGAIGRMADLWWNVADYSHGFLVIPMALYLAWSRRDRLPPRSAPDPVAKVLLLTSLFATMVGHSRQIDPLVDYALPFALAGLVGTLHGRARLYWSLPVAAYLALMIPLPRPVAFAFSEPLQWLGAHGSVFLLQTLGYDSAAVGTEILLPNDRLNVAVACSGLQMIMTFLAVTSAIAMLSTYPLIGKLVLTLLALPISIVANILRITAIAAFHAHGRLPFKFLHDAGGFLFIPVTIGVVFAGIYFFERAFPRIDGQDGATTWESSE